MNNTTLADVLRENKKEILQNLSNVFSQLDKNSVLARSIHEKNKSEIYSNALEEIISNIFQREVQCEKCYGASGNDQLPDVVMEQKNGDKQALEIKVTNTKTVRGGCINTHHSSGDYLLCYRNPKKKDFQDEWCLIYLILSKEDWIKPACKNYYGPTIKPTTIKEKLDKNEATILVGNIDFRGKNSFFEYERTNEG